MERCVLYGFYDDLRCFFFYSKVNSVCSVCTQMCAHVCKGATFGYTRNPSALVKPDACTVNTFAPRHFDAQYRKRVV